MVKQLFNEFNWAAIVFVSIVAGISEELLFRGVIQNLLVNITSPLFGILISALLFGLIHCYNRLYVLLAFSMGLIIGCLYYVSQSLLMVMVLHATYDIFAFALIVKYPRFISQH